MTRHGQVVRLKPESRSEYIRLHQAVWPGVLKTIAECNIRNYSIFDSGELLFAYFEYTGSDFAADMAKMAACPETQRWGGGVSHVAATAARNTGTAMEGAARDLSLRRRRIGAAGWTTFCIPTASRVRIRE